MIITSQIMIHLSKTYDKRLFFIFISSNLIYHVIILDYEFHELKCNVLEVLFIETMCKWRFIFFSLECFMIILFVVFSLSPLKTMVCNLNFNLLVCDCKCVLFKLFRSIKILGR